MTSAPKNTRVGTKANARKLLITALEANARALRDTERTLTNLICRASKSGIPQTTIAQAAGVSQAHISRTLAANRALQAARKEQRAAKKAGSDGSV